MSLFNFQSRGTNVAIMGGLLALGGGLIAGGCVALAQADCSQAVVQACYGSTDATIDDDTTSCINARSELTNCDPGGLEYHAQYADTCISAHQQVYVNAVLQESDVQALQTACLPVFNNNGQQGASCTSDTDCDAGDGYSCIIHQGTPGKCEMPVSVMGGETCTDPAAQCVDTFFCNTGGNCIADPVNGRACDVGVPCSDGLRCVSSVCKPQLGDGAACSSDTDCTGGFCLTTSWVEGAGVRSATYTFSITSASCNAFR